MRVLTLSLFATILSAPAFAADLGTYRPGTAYHSVIAPVADVCDSQCSGDAQCRGWNYVKSNPQAPGVCEFLSSVSSPISSQISISGVNGLAAPYSSRLANGGTNTIRVGTQVAPNRNTVTVGQSPSGRRIIRQAPTQRIRPQQTVSKSTDNLSLTEQQNRYRHGAVSTPAPLRGIQTPAVPAQTRHQIPAQPAPQAYQQPQFQQKFVPQRPAFQPHLDSGFQQPSPQNFQQPTTQIRQNPPFENLQFQQPRLQQAQPQAQQPQRQASRRATGPRRAPVQAAIQPPVQNAPSYDASQYQNRPYQAPQNQGAIQNPQFPQGGPAQPFPPQPYPSQPYPPQNYQAPPTKSAAIPPSGGQQPALRRGSPRPPVGQPIPPTPAPVGQPPINQAYGQAAPQAPLRPRRSTPGQRLAQLTAQTKGAAPSIPTSGPIALTPEQAQKSLFGRLNDDVRAPEDTPDDMPITTAVPTQPVFEQNLDDVLAGGR